MWICVKKETKFCSFVENIEYSCVERVKNVSSSVLCISTLTSI